MGQYISATCPKCSRPLRLWVDDSSGPPDEVGTECICGAIPVWKLDCYYAYDLREFDHYEREESPYTFETGQRVRIKQSAFKESPELEDLMVLGEVGWIEPDPDNGEGCWLWFSETDDGETMTYVTSAEIEPVAEEALG